MWVNNYVKVIIIQKKVRVHDENIPEAMDGAADDGN